MGKTLVIVESPTKARTITKMLGSKYKVTATGGHLRDLPKSRMGVDIENRYQPEYINVRGKAPAINSLKKEAKASDRVLLGTDPDREGEAIAWHVATLLDLDLDDQNRVEFHEITKDKVKEAVQNPRSIDLNLVDAQQARRIMDRIMGYQLSPILWKRVKSGLSAGRVQSVALRIICEREAEIKAFIPEEYWSITANHVVKRKKFDSTFQGLWNGDKLKKLELKDQASTQEVVDAVTGKPFIVRSVKQQKRMRKPYAPYTTSTLQQDASRRFGFSTSRTMSIAQGLFEGVNIGTEGSVGLITYMRTDSTRLSDVIVKEALGYIQHKYGKEYAGKGNPYGSQKSGAQDAHEGIRPSSILREPESIRSFLTNDQFKLYDLIWRRTVASQMTNAQFKQTAIDLDAQGYYFRANGNVMVFDGFMAVWPTKDSTSVLPEVEEGQALEAKKILPEQHFTKPPARYTEASLVKKMEEAGIGRPSTYAATIQSILSRHYVELVDKQFYPTEIGTTVNTLLVRSFDDVINEDFTAEMEKELDEIADQNKDWLEVMDAFYELFSKDMEKVQSDETSYKIQDEVLDEACPECGNHLVIKRGRRGKFIGCSNFPECTYTRPIVKSTGVKCPKCETGELIERVSKRGKKFYGCSNYPDCDFALWDLPIDDTCPKCDSLLTRKKNRRGDVIKCSNPTCDYEIETSDYQGKAKLK